MVIGGASRSKNSPNVYTRAVVGRVAHGVGYRAQLTALRFIQAQGMAQLRRGASAVTRDNNCSSCYPGIPVVECAHNLP